MFPDHSNRSTALIYSDVTRRTGDIKEISPTTDVNADYKYVWVLKNFTNCYKTSGIAYVHESEPIFIGSNLEYQWTFDLYVAGYNCKNSNYVGFCPFLRCQEKHKDTKFTVEVSVLDKDDKKQFTRKITLTHENINTSNGLFEDFVLRSDLWNKPDLMPNDELKIACQIRIGEPSTTDEIDELQRTQNFSQRILEKLWEDRRFCDFNLIVGKKEFCVHRAILAAASPVFGAMFESKMREAGEGKVDIEDIEPDIMEKTLRFIYIGKLDDVEDLTSEILVVAEKYQLDSLKQLCENVLVKQLNVENVFETILLADQNNAEELKKQAVDFFLRNAKKLYTSAANIRACINTLPINLQTEIICTFMAKL